VKNLTIPENKNLTLTLSSPLTEEDKGGGEKINNSKSKKSFQTSSSPLTGEDKGGGGCSIFP
jgi:hypothetical protein